MELRTFHCSRRGAAHVRSGLPLQDASLCEQQDGLWIAVVADGHGSRRHFRSEVGSKIACDVCAQEIRNLMNNADRMLLTADEQLDVLKRRICMAWRREVLAHHAEYPWTEEELEEQRQKLSAEQLQRLMGDREADLLIPYGSTLCAVFSDGFEWMAIQQGDGGFLHISENGEYTWPMPESTMNEGNRTASLCQENAMMDFRHCYGVDQPAGLLVYSDGIEKVFPPAGKEVASLLHWIWKNEVSGSETRMENLERTLDMLTNRSRIGDDVSAAGIVNAQAEDMEPRLGKQQKQLEAERLAAEITEIGNTLEYNLQRLQQMWDMNSDAAQQLREILRRKKADLTARCDAYYQLCNELDIEKKKGFERWLAIEIPDDPLVPDPEQEEPEWNEADVDADDGAQDALFELDEETEEEDDIFDLEEEPEEDKITKEDVINAGRELLRLTRMNSKAIRKMILQGRKKDEE